MVSVSPHLPLPKRLEEAAAEVTRVLDEMLSARLTLIVEPDVYAVIADFDRWWRPLPYPKILNTALEPVVDKLVSGITLRALMGQRSDMLSARLRQAVGDAKEAQKRLALIADAEVGLTPDTQDWLHGNIRTESSTSEIAANTLQSVATQDILASIATLLLDAHEISSEAASNSEITHHLARMLNRIKSIAAEQGLEVAGRTGEIVEFSPAAHETGGAGPAETRVRIVRPMIVRQRRDGGRDILLKALVAEI